jgi:hypothetical protein
VELVPISYCARWGTITYSEFALLATPTIAPRHNLVSFVFHPDGTETIPSELFTRTLPDWLVEEDLAADDDVVELVDLPPLQLQLFSWSMIEISTITIKTMDIIFLPCPICNPPP